MNWGEVWLGQVGHEARPVVILTRPEVIDVRTLVTVAEITPSDRGLAADVALDDEAAGCNRPAGINCDRLATINQSTLTTRASALDHPTIARGCRAARYALGC